MRIQSKLEVHHPQPSSTDDQETLQQPRSHRISQHQASRAASSDQETLQQRKPSLHNESSSSDETTRTAPRTEQPFSDEETAVHHANLWSPGAHIDNRYQLIQPLGAGAWGTIWKARQTGIERFVALKILKERDEPGMRKARSRFEREAKLASRVRHPSAVRILDFGHIQNQPYLVMEWLEGISLQRFLNDCGPLPPELVLDLGMGVCGALHAAHQEGVIHRDLKPSNIMLVETSSGLTPVVVDFGLARTFTPDEPTVTHANMIVGTPAYMSPESIRGRPLTPASDIYSLGATFLTLLLGDNPFRGENGSVTMTNHLLGPSFDDEALQRVGCSPEFAHTLMAMIAMSPEERPTARALEDQFKMLLDQFILDPDPLDEFVPFSNEFFASESIEHHDPPSTPYEEPTESEKSELSEKTAPEIVEETDAVEQSQEREHFVVEPTSTVDLPLPPPRDRNAPRNQQTPYSRPYSRVPILVSALLLALALPILLTQHRKASVNAITPPPIAADVPELPVETAPNTPAPASFEIPALTPTAFYGLSVHTQPPASEDVNRAHIAPPTSSPPNDEDSIDVSLSKQHVAAASPTKLEINTTASFNSDSPSNAIDAPPSTTTRAKRRTAVSRSSNNTHKPASLVLTISPPGHVYVDGHSHGLRSSLMLEEISSGRHTIKVEREGQTMERRVRLESGRRHVETF